MNDLGKDWKNFLLIGRVKLLDFLVSEQKKEGGCHGVQYLRTVTLTVVVWLNVPLLPVTVIVYVPVLVLLDTVIVSVDFPEVEIETGLRLAANPVGALADNVTLPVKPLRAVIVIVEVPRDPLLIVNDAGDAEIEKSGEVTCTVRLMVWLNDPLLPVTVTVYVPLMALVGTFMLSVDWPDVEIEVGLRSAVQPVGAVVESVTVSENPLRNVLLSSRFPRIRFRLSTWQVTLTVRSLG